MADRRAHEQLDRSVVVDLVAVDNAAVAVGRVFAEADVGREHELGEAGAQFPKRALDDPVVVVRARALFVLLLGNPEEQHRRDPEPDQRLRLIDERVDRALPDSRQTLERVDDALAGTGEEWHHEVAEVEPCLPHEGAQAARPAQAPEPRRRERTHAVNLRVPILVTSPKTAP